MSCDQRSEESAIYMEQRGVLACFRPYHLCSPGSLSPTTPGTLPTHWPTVVPGALYAGLQYTLPYHSYATVPGLHRSMAPTQVSSNI